jgi:GT2 family glycosyltransferase
MDPRGVTIIVLNWNLREETLACLESLRQANLGGASVMVVDNGSRDGSAEAVRARFPTVEVVALAENRGYAGGNNAGIRVALERGAEAVLLLNNDTRVVPDFLSPLLWVFDKYPRAAAVGSAIHRFDRPEMLDVAYISVCFARNVVQLQGVNKLPGHGFTETVQVDAAPGCSLLIRAAALRQVGLFDEDYFAYYEEVDWCVRARRAGWEIWYEPLSRVLHRGSLSTAGLQEAAPESAPAPGDEALENAEPPSWNVIRTYLGARNRVRLLRSYATPRERLGFALWTLHTVPLELLAWVMHREGWYALGRWSYPSMLRWYCLERHGEHRWSAAALLRAARNLVLDLPRDVWRAHRSGRTAQIEAHVAGLWHGLLNRPVDYAALGLK